MTRKYVFAVIRNNLGINVHNVSCGKMYTTKADQ